MTKRERSFRSRFLFQVFWRNIPPFTYFLFFCFGTLAIFYMETDRVTLFRRENRKKPEREEKEKDDE